MTAARAALRMLSVRRRRRGTMSYAYAEASIRRYRARRRVEPRWDHLRRRLARTVRPATWPAFWPRPDQSAAADDPEQQSAAHQSAEDQSVDEDQSAAAEHASDASDDSPTSPADAPDASRLPLTTNRSFTRTRCP